MSLPLPRIESQLLNPQPSDYTDWATCCNVIVIYPLLFGNPSLLFLVLFCLFCHKIQSSFVKYNVVHFITFDNLDIAWHHGFTRTWTHDTLFCLSATRNVFQSSELVPLHVSRPPGSGLYAPDILNILQREAKCAAQTSKLLQFIFAPHVVMFLLCLHFHRSCFCSCMVIFVWAWRFVSLSHI
jgi:hypothetical protein